MFPGYLENRKELGYEALVDTNCGIRLVAITEVIADKTISRLTVSVSNNKKFVPIVFSGIAPLLPESHPVFIRILRSVTVGVILYYVTKTVFPEKPMVEPIPEKPLVDGTKPIPRGGVLDHISKRILQDRAFKVAVIGATFAFGYDLFITEIIQLLSSPETFTEYEKGTLPKEIADMIEEFELLDLPSKIRGIVVKDNLSRDHKIVLLKIKLDSIINGDYPNKKLAVAAILASVLATVLLAGPYGIMLFLAALYQLWKEGKISTAMYKKISQEAIKQLNRA